MKLKTIDIKGKEYVPVSERVKAFRKDHTDFGLITSIVSIEDSVVIMKAEVVNPEGRTIATGFASEKQGSSFINKTSFIENCETSAIGRCLGNFGIGVDDSYSSANEVANAITQQSVKEPKIITPNIESIPSDIATKVSLKLEGCEDLETLGIAYKECIKDIQKYPSLKAMFTAKKIKLK